MLLVMNLLRETSPKNNNKREHSEHGIRHELYIRRKLPNDLSNYYYKVRCNKLRLKSLK